MKTVHKYSIPIQARFAIAMPRGSTVIHVAEQRAQMRMWAVVDIDAPEEVRHFQLVGTGHPVEEPEVGTLTHVGSAVNALGSLVWHVFEVKA